MNDFNLKAGTTAGTLLTLVCTVNVDSLFETVILAAIGASVSFLVSLFWKYLCSKYRNNQ